jgi:hypothetical protein
MNIKYILILLPFPKETPEIDGHSTNLPSPTITRYKGCHFSSLCSYMQTRALARPWFTGNKVEQYLLFVGADLQQRVKRTETHKAGDNGNGCQYNENDAQGAGHDIGEIQSQ